METMTFQEAITKGLIEKARNGFLLCEPAWKAEGNWVDGREPNLCGGILKLRGGNSVKIVSDTNEQICTRQIFRTGNEMVRFAEYGYGVEGTGEHEQVLIGHTSVYRRNDGYVVEWRYKSGTLLTKNFALLEDATSFYQTI